MIVKRDENPENDAEDDDNYSTENNGYTARPSINQLQKSSALLLL